MVTGGALNFAAEGGGEMGPDRGGRLTAAIRTDVQQHAIVRHPTECEGTCSLVSSDPGHGEGLGTPRRSVHRSKQIGVSMGRGEGSNYIDMHMGEGPGGIGCVGGFPQLGRRGTAWSSVLCCGACAARGSTRQ